MKKAFLASLFLMFTKHWGGKQKKRKKKKGEKRQISVTP